MKLQVLLINGKNPLNEGVNLPNESPDLIVVSENALNGYQEISSIENWDSFSGRIGKDYKWVRARIKPYGEVDDDAWDAYTDEQREIICKYKATSIERVIAHYGPVVNLATSAYDEASIECRRHRFSIMKAEIMNNVDQPSQMLIMGTLNATHLVNNYVLYGVEGMDQGDSAPGVFDWIESKNGFEGAGLSELSITITTSKTLPEIIAELIQIGIHGEY